MDNAKKYRNFEINAYFIFFVPAWPTKKHYIARRMRSVELLSCIHKPYDENALRSRWRKFNTRNRSYNRFISLCRNGCGTCRVVDAVDICESLSAVKLSLLSSTGVQNDTHSHSTHIVGCTAQTHAVWYGD
jgi:hypothetical protein